MGERALSWLFYNVRSKLFTCYLTPHTWLSCSFPSDLVVHQVIINYYLLNARLAKINALSFKEALMIVQLDIRPELKKNANTKLWHLQLSF